MASRHRRAPRHTRTVERVPGRDGRPPLELVRSSRRRRTASAFARDGVIVVQLPAGMAAADERRMVAQLVDKVTGRLQAERVGGDDELADRARRLADRYLDGVLPSSIRWSDRMTRRWASCTQTDGTIRISRRLATMPEHVLDAVIVHELAHLQAEGHGQDFHALVDRYPHTQRARGFLEGIKHAEARSAMPDDALYDDLEPAGADVGDGQPSLWPVPSSSPSSSSSSSSPGTSSRGAASSSSSA